MEFIAKIFPFIPEKGDSTKLVVGLLFYISGSFVAIAITPVVLGLTIVLAILIPIVEPLILVYAISGVVFTITGFAGITNFKNNK